jgi:histidyl-tRNA synthetase
MRLDVIVDGLEAEKKSWDLIEILEQHNIAFNLSLSNQSLHKKIKKATQSDSIGCVIIGNNEITDSTVTVKWFREYCQETVQYKNIATYLQRKLEAQIINMQT